MQTLEETLLAGEVNDIVDQYQEHENLNVQLVIFRSKNSFKSSVEAANMMRRMAVVMAGERPSQGLTLVRLLLVDPVS